MNSKTLEFIINIENKGNFLMTIPSLEHLNKSYVFSMLEKRHYAKSESEFIQLLHHAKKYEEEEKNDFSRAYESLIKLGEIVEILPFAEAYRALIETANSTRFYSVRSAKIRTFKQLLRYHQICVESQAWVIQYFQEKLHDFEIAKRRLRTFIRRGYI
jgi:hypothetical protein